MTVYVLEGKKNSAREGSYEVLGVYTTAALIEQASEKFRESGYVTFSGFICEVDDVPQS